MPTLIRATRLAASLGLIGLCVGLASCGAGDDAASGGSAPGIVATVGDRQISRQALDDYLAAALGGPGEQEPVEAEVRSRLLDQLIDEEMILGEAERQGLSLTGADRQAHLLPEARGADSKGLDRVLLQRKFKQEVILKGVTVAAEEVEAYFRDHINEFRQPAQAVVRKILMDDRREAERVRAEVLARPGEFEAIAAEKSLAPDGGQAQSYEEELLPEALRSQLETLEPGQVSPVVEDPQGLFILRLEGRQPASVAELEQVRERIEFKLLAERSERRYQEFLADLREKTAVKIHEDQLPFAYVKKP